MAARVSAIAAASVGASPQRASAGAAGAKSMNANKSVPASAMACTRFEREFDVIEDPPLVALRQRDGVQCRTRVIRAAKVPSYLRADNTGFYRLTYVFYAGAAMYRTHPGPLEQSAAKTSAANS